VRAIVRSYHGRNAIPSNGLIVEVAAGRTIPRAEATSKCEFGA
jgi:hypothetical protein